jgi:YHS domain-containing protein
MAPRFPRFVLPGALGALALSACATRNEVSTAPKPFLAGARAHYLVDEDGLAGQGYDVVAYHPEGGGKAREGREDLAVDVEGVTYWFATPENRELFRANPARYEPTYGGWCAHAMADGGRKVTIDPENYLLTDGRLFLFFKSFYADALKNWYRDDPAQQTPKADAWWKTITGEDARGY